MSGRRPCWSGTADSGSLLPSVAEQLDGRPRVVVFVDAGLPPCDGGATAGGDHLDHLRRIAVDGVLPKWSTWWGETAMEMLVPDVDRRAELEAEIPEIPLGFFESTFAVPAGWCQTRSSFLLLSEPYRDHADRARALGWTTVELLGAHLDIVNDPDQIATAITELAS